MAKDPATLWYWNDWSGGTARMSRFHKGCYMDLLHAQFNGGNLSLDEIKTVLGSDFGSAWPTLQKKFKIGEDNLYYNERLVFEIQKRKGYTKSRRDNLEGKSHMAPHMENENGNELEIDKELRERYGEGMIEDFLRYWNEPDKKGKCRWELQKTWSTPGRLATWSRNNFNKTPVSVTQRKTEAEIKEEIAKRFAQ